jgi:hypothetical protein
VRARIETCGATWASDEGPALALVPGQVGLACLVDQMGWLKAVGVVAEMRYFVVFLAFAVRQIRADVVNVVLLSLSRDPFSFALT